MACAVGHAGMHDDDYYGNVLPEVEDEGFDEDVEAEQENLDDADWQVLAGQLPQRDLDTEGSQHGARQNPRREAQASASKNSQARSD